MTRTEVRMSDFDHDKYGEALVFLAKTAYEEYRLVCLEILKHQSSLLHTYLWLSSLVATLQAGFYFKVASGEIAWQGVACSAGVWFYLFAAISFAASLGAFALGVDTLRGREVATLPLGPFPVLAKMAHEMAAKPGSFELYSAVITALDAEIDRQAQVKSVKGEKLRFMSRLMLLSVGFFVLAALAVFDC